MKLNLCILLATLTLTACSTAPAYKAAHGSSYGYRETAITEDRYRVSYKARGDNSSAAMDFALRRAAELTLLKGYDWFVVSNRETLVNQASNKPYSGVSMQQQQTVVHERGLLGSRTYYYPTGTTYGVHMHTGAKSASVESILEIKMGKGDQPADGASYNPVAITQNLK